MRWPRFIETRVYRDSWDIYSFREHYVSRNLTIRRWPDIISHFLWKYKAVNKYMLIWQNTPMRVDFDTDTLFVRDENMVEWLRSNTRGEVRYSEQLSYRSPWAKPSEFCTSSLEVHFLNPKDAMLFRLTFG